MIAFLLIVIIGIALWLGMGMHHDASLERLEQTGFTVSYTLQGDPPVVFDEVHKKLAFLKLTKSLVYDYDQVLRWEWGTQEYPGWNDKSEPTKTPYLIFYLQDKDYPSIRIEGLDQAEISRWRKQLPTLLSRAPPERS